MIHKPGCPAPAANRAGKQEAADTPAGATRPIPVRNVISATGAGSAPKPEIQAQCANGGPVLFKPYVFLFS